MSLSPLRHQIKLCRPLTSAILSCAASTTRWLRVPAPPLSPHRRMAACLHLATVARPTGRYAPSRRPRRAPLATAAAAAGPADFSPEQLQAGLQQQLRGNGEQAGVVEPSAFTSQVPPKKASRREERAAAAAAAVRIAAHAGLGLCRLACHLHA